MFSNVTSYSGNAKRLLHCNYVLFVYEPIRCLRMTDARSLRGVLRKLKEAHIFLQCPFDIQETSGLIMICRTCAWRQLTIQWHISSMPWYTFICDLYQNCVHGSRFGLFCFLGLHIFFRATSLPMGQSELKHITCISTCIPQERKDFPTKQNTKLRKFMDIYNDVDN